MSSSSSLIAAATVFEALPSTPVRRQLGTSIDDAAIFLEDTVDRATAQCIDASPSALALLSPQSMPTSRAAHVDITEYDANNLGSLSTSHRKGTAGSSSGSSNTSRSRTNCLHHRALHDVTNTSATKLHFGVVSTSKSPTPTAARGSMSHPPAPHGASHNTSFARSASQRSSYGRSPSASEPMVPLAEYEGLQRERNRYEKMYEHQRALYEEMAHKHSEAYQSLQNKIIEVVALSTRNEESKRFIRQLKREMSESRTRVMDMQNKVLEETKLERSARVRYEALLNEHERKYEWLVERHETKLVAMEGLVKDLTCLRGEQDRVHISQLDSLLKAAYSKSAALFNDLLRQGKQIDLLYDAKGALEMQLEQQRKEKREMEAMLREERRHMATETERMVDQIEEQQQSILNLRQMLIRTLDNRENTFACSGDSCYDGHNEGGEDGSDGGGSDCSSSGNPCSLRASPILDRGTSWDEEGEDVASDDVYAMLAGKETTSQGFENRCSPVRRRAATTAARPVITVSRASADAIVSNSVVAPRSSMADRSQSSTASAATSLAAEVSPWPLTSSDDQLLLCQRSYGKSSSRSHSSSENCASAALENSELPEDIVEKGIACNSNREHSRGGSENDGTADNEVRRSSRSATGTASSAVSRRQIDFSMALAAVRERRRRDRVAHEDGGLKHTLDKENSKPHTQQREIIRSNTIGSIPTARKGTSTHQNRVRGDSQQVEDEGAEPRLFSRNALRSRE